LLPGTPNRFRWDGTAFREIVHFGKWLLGSSSIGFLAGTIDKMVLGALSSAATLGVYSIAGLLYYALDQIFSKVASELSFPAFSEVARERVADLRKVIYKFHTPLAILAYGSAGFLLESAPTIVKILYDDRYQDAGWMLQIMALMLFATPARIHGAAILSLGYARVAFLQSVFCFAVSLVAIPVGFYYFNLAGAIWGVVAGQSSPGLISLYFAFKRHLVNVRRELAPLLAVVPGALLGFCVSELVAYAFWS